ncbi:MAG: hypothetical protein ACXVPD_07865 [Bacteroidia bacterium]
MKKLSLSFLFALVACLTSVAQTTAKKSHALQTGKWYATGVFDGKAITLSQQNANSDWEATFAPSGYLHNCSTLKSPVVSAEGNEIKAGTFYCDTLYSYTIKNNMISIKYLTKGTAYSYKISPNGSGSYVLAPVAINAGSNQ